MGMPSALILDRAGGVLLGLACGDALGVAYEGGPPLAAEFKPQMKGGGYGPYSAAEYSDDTQMAVCIAQVAATGANLAEDEALDAIAARFLAWARGGANDIGLQTQSVLARARRLKGPAGRRLRRAASEYYELHPDHAAGNGALMRTAVVGLSAAHDRKRTAIAARAIAALTHADPLAGDSCVLWSEAIRVAVVGGRCDLSGGLDLIPEQRRQWWRNRIESATDAPPSRFTRNGFSPEALQAAWAAITSTPLPADDPAACRSASQHLKLALQAAVRSGNDTDTVAAITGSLLGAFWGASAVPLAWAEAVHGWSGDAVLPVYRAAELIQLAEQALRHSW